MGISTITPDVMSHDVEGFDDSNPPITEREDAANDVAAGDAEIPATGDDEIQSAAPAIAAQSDDRIHHIPISDISVDPDQPRDEGADYDLGASVKENGVLQPITVRRHPKAGERIVGINMTHPPYMIVDGERRYRGAQAAKLSTIPARLVDNAEDDGDRLLHQVLFNDGKRLKPMEEARSWKRIMAAKGWRIQQLAAALGRPKSTVSDRLALLDAPAAFQKLFLDGTLTAAAAPIVRSIAHLRDDLIEKIVAQVEHDYQWQQASAAGKSVPLTEVERAINNALTGYPFTEVTTGDEGYTGETFEVKGRRFAVDRADYYRYQQDRRFEAAGVDRTKAADDYQARQAAENKKRRLKRERTVALRRAQFDALTEKLPTSLDQSALFFVIGALVDEMQLLTQAAAGRALGIPMPAKKQFGSPDWKGALMAHAATLDVKGRVKMLLQLGLAQDLVVSEYGPDSDGKRLAHAALTFGVNLKKVKAPDPATAKKPGIAVAATTTSAKATTPAKAKRSLATKAPATKRAPNVAFMQPHQPSAELGAIVGTKPLPRTEITKKLWAHIKKQGLQGKDNDRRNIYPDAKLKAVLGGRTKVSMFEMTKLVNKHLKPSKV